MAECPDKIEKVVQSDASEESTGKDKDSEYLELSETVDVKTLINPGLNPSLKLSGSGGRTLKLYDSKEEQDVLFQFFTHLSAMDPQTIKKLPTTVQYIEGSGLRSHSISKKDLLFAILSRCDKLLLQDVISKLYSIGLAVPIVIPCVNSGRKKVLGHALRKCFHYHFDPKSGTREKIHLVDYKALCISAMRIGDIKFSKSKLLNALLSKMTNGDGNNFYITSEKDTPNSLLSKGTVEAVWHISDQTNGDCHTPSFLLLNARGDGYENSDIQTIFECMCNINIVFVSDNISGNRLQKITQILQMSSNVVLIYENIPPDLLPPQVIVLKYEKSSENNIIDRLAEIIQQNKTIKISSASNFACLSSMAGMENDEERFIAIRKTAQDVASVIPNSSVGLSKTVPLSNHLKQNDSLENFQKQKAMPIKSKIVSPPKIIAFSRFLQMIKFDNEGKQMFLSYLKIFLEQKFFSKVCCFDTYQLSAHDREVSNVSCTFSDKSFTGMEKNALTVEQFLFELLLVLEFRRDWLPTDIDKSQFNNCLATWMLNGNAINLVNFDSRQSPFALMQAAVSGIKSLIGGDASLRVVSVFGEDWRATCLLLNGMFGTGITEGEAICSGGPTIHLIPIVNNRNTAVNSEYLFLIPLGTHSRSKITQDKNSEIKNQILNVLSSITDVFILNVEGEHLNSEQAVAFKMVAYCLMKQAARDKRKCCVVYNVKNIPSTSLQDLEDYTFFRLGKLFQSIHKTRNQGETIKKGGSFRDSGTYFMSNSTVIVKLLPALKYSRGFQAEKEYLSKLYDLQNIIVEILREHNSMPANLETIAELLDFSSENLKKQNALNSDSVQSQKKPRDNDHCSMKDNVSDQSNISKGTVLNPNEVQSRILESVSNLVDNINDSEADGNIKSATKNKSESFDTRLKRKIEDSDTFEQKEEEESNLRAGEVCKTDECQHHDKIADEEQHNTKVKFCVSSNICGISNEKEKQSIMSEPNVNIDEVLELESKTFFNGLERTMDDSFTPEQKKEHVEAYSIQHLADIKDKHPSRTFHEIRSWTKNVVTNELKKDKYGKEVNNFVSEGLRDDLHNLTESVVSMEDVRKFKIKFNNTFEEDKEALRVCLLKLETLSCEYTKFENSSQNMVLILKDQLHEFSNLVNKMTICIFLCIKFAFKIHKQHVIADLVKIDTTVSKRVVDFGSYVITCEEPLKFKSLDKKLEWIIPLLKGAFTDDIFSQLAEHISSANALNYESIPLDMQTLQKLDINFLKLLPVVSSNNMDHILRAVNESKSHVLGKILGQAPFNFDESFNHVYTLIKSMFTDAPQIEAIKASAFVHVLAWSSTFISVKIHQSEKENSIPSFFEKLLPILKFNCNIYANEKLQEEFSDQVYIAIQKTLLEHIPQEIESDLRKALLQNHKLFMFKQLFIEDMLSSFCKMKDYLSLLAFVESYENCGEKFVLSFLAKIINSNNISMIADLKVQVINKNINKAIFGVKKATLICMENKDETLYTWTKFFQKFLSKTNRKIFKHLDRKLHFNDIESFCDQFCDSLERLKENLHNSIELPEEGNVDETRTWMYSLPNNMYKEISRNVLGCKEQCPLCGNVCEYSIAIHYSHSTPCHIPTGIKGELIKNSNMLSSLTCSDLVSQENVAISPEQDEDFCENISDSSQKLHPNWDIPGDENSCSVFWKYIFSRFNRQFSQFFECEEGKVPPEWAKISEEEAVDSITRSNNVS